MLKRHWTAFAIVSVLVSVPLLAEDTDTPDGKSDEAPKRLEIGAKIPASVAKLELEGTDGKKHSIKGVAGKHGTLLMFSCNSCPWVVHWEPRIAKICNEYRKKGIGVIVVNSNGAKGAREKDGPEAMKKRAKERGFEFPYVFDPTSAVARAFHATKTPEAFLFDAEGKLVYTGTIDDNARDPSAVEKPYLRNALEAMLKGIEITDERTKALGCEIKFAEKPDGT